MEINGKVYRNLEGQVGYLTDKYDDLQNQINDVRAHLTHYVEVDTLPTGDDIDPSAVYLLGPMGTAPDQYYEEWVYVQKADESWVWEKLGDTDSVDLSGYLEKQTGATTNRQAYIKNTDGTQGMIDINPDGVDAVNGRLAMYGTSGRLRVGEPNNGSDAASKQYVDNNYIAKDSATSSYDQVYGKTQAGVQTKFNVASGAYANAIPVRDGNGQIALPNQGTNFPSDDQAISKRFGDGAYLAKQTGASSLAQVYGKTGVGDQVMIDVYSGIVNSAIVQRTAYGQINVPSTPTDNSHAASKEYVDAAVGQLLYLHDINLVFTIDSSNYLIVRAHLVSGSPTAITSLTREQYARMNVEYGSYGTSNNASDVSANAICSVTKLPGSFRFDDFTEAYTGFLYQYVSGSTLLWGVADNTMTVTVTDVVVSF